MTDATLARFRLSATQRIMLRGLALFGLLVVAGAAVGSPRASVRSSVAATPYTGTAAELRRRDAAAAREQSDLARLERQRADAIGNYASAYGLSDDLAGLIYDLALREGIDPDLGFRLVKIESGFQPDARSHAGAIGLAQVMPATALFYDRTVTPHRLTDPKVNLTIGFRYLRYLLDRYNGDLRLALLAYNRGPTRVGELLARGIDPRNGYASSVTEGYRPTPTLP